MDQQYIAIVILKAEDEEGVLGMVTPQYYGPFSNRQAARAFLNEFDPVLTFVMSKTIVPLNAV